MEHTAHFPIEEPDPIRGMRLDFGDDRIFWFRDDLHTPYAITPFGMSTIARGHMWGYALAAEEAKLPPSRGALVKTHLQRVYLGFVGIDDPAEVEARAKEFGAFIDRSIDNWQEFYHGSVEEGRQLVMAGLGVELPGMSYGELAEHLRRSQKVNLRCWYLHFMSMYVADTVYTIGESWVKSRGLVERDYTTLLKGFETKALATDRGQYLLCRSAMAKPEVLGVLESECSASEVLLNLRDTDQGGRWLEELRDYLDIYGHRSAAAILDVNYPTWYEDPSPVLTNIRSLLTCSKAGWDFEADRRATIRSREEAIVSFRLSLNAEDRESFDANLPRWQRAYAFNEDHFFYWEQGNWSVLHYAIVEVGGRLAALGVINAADDIYQLTLDEVLETLDCLEEAEGPATYAYAYLLKPLIAHRTRNFEIANAEKTHAFVGRLPEAFDDPIAIKVFGITSHVLEKAREAMAGVKGEEKTRLDGFPGSPGIVEGRARVILDHEGFATIGTGEIMVCPYTSPAWTPVFPKIIGVVTDSGGMLTHAAISARDYGIPAVVGTWEATGLIRDGDIIRVNGNEGCVEIIERANP